jgi:site-specific DNA-adenine methylase
MLAPMLSYFGGKWRTALHYPPPRYDTIVEPFAGGAGFSLRYPHKKVILVDRDEKIAAVWQYLIKVKSSEILCLPLIRNGESVDDLPIGEEGRLLLGYWISHGSASPRKTPSAWMREASESSGFWGEAIRYRIARQVEYIRHWKMIHGDYTDAPDHDATWFIDPPYQQAGKSYRYSSKKIDFDHLGDFCKTRSREVIACENAGADWLPFEPFRNVISTNGKVRSGKSKEVVWYSNPPLTLFNVFNAA